MQGKVQSQCHKRSRDIAGSKVSLTQRVLRDPMPSRRNLDVVSSEHVLNETKQPNDFSFLMGGFSNQTTLPLPSVPCTGNIKISFSEVLTRAYDVRRLELEPIEITVASPRKITALEKQAFDSDLNFCSEDSNIPKKYEIALVPQTEWDLLFEMALNAASWSPQDFAT